MAYRTVQYRDIDRVYPLPGKRRRRAGKPAAAAPTTALVPAAAAPGAPATPAVTVRGMGEIGKFRFGRFLKGVARAGLAVGTGGASELVRGKVGRALLSGGASLAFEKKKRRAGAAAAAAKGKRKKGKGRGASAGGADDDAGGGPDEGDDQGSDDDAGDDAGGDDDAGDDAGGDEEGMEGLAGFSFKKLAAGIGKGLKAAAGGVVKIGGAIGKQALLTYLPGAQGGGAVGAQTKALTVVAPPTPIYKNPWVIGGGAALLLGAVVIMSRKRGGSTAAV